MDINPKRPLSPDAMERFKEQVIPDFVFEAFNHCIALALVNGIATVKQSDVLKMIREKGLIPESNIINSDWLNVEVAYEAMGWKVTYDKPAYNESYSAIFEFKRKK